MIGHHCLARTILVFALLASSVQLFAQQRPKIQGSMIGYVDNAIVGNQIRTRFDAGFNMVYADRAEFFYAKTGIFETLPTTSPAFDPNAPGPGPGVPVNLNFQQLYVTGEYAPNRRVSFFGEFPLRWVQPQSFRATGFPDWPSASGVGDVRFGAKAAIVANEGQYLTFQFKTATASGDSHKGLGTAHVSVEPAVLYYQQISDRAAIESEAGFIVPLDGSAGVPTNNSKKFAGDIFFYGVGPSYELYRGNTVQFAPVVELVGWKVMNGYRTAIDGPIAGIAAKADANIVNIKFGARVSLGSRNSIYAGWGHALTNAKWYEDVLRIEHRFSF